MNTFTRTFTSIRRYAISHKLVSSIVAIIVIIVGYYGYKKVFGSSTSTQYALAAVEKGTITASVSASGQVSASNEMGIIPKVSGQVTAINVTVGQEVKAGTVLARIDSTDAYKTLRNAQQSLTSAKIAYQKSIQQSQSTASTNSQAVDTATTDLANAYKDAYDTIANTYIDMPATSIALNAIYYTLNHSPYFADQAVQSATGDAGIKYKYQAGVSLDKAKNDFDANFPAFKSATASSDPDTIIALLKQTYTTAREFQDALKGTYNAIDYINLRITTNKPPEISTDESAINTYLGKINSDVSALTNALTTIQDAKQKLADAKTTLANTQASLNGVDNLDIESAKNSLTSAQNSYNDAAENLGYYTITAPFDGVVAKISAKVGDNASSGSALITEITPQQIATLSFNEVDIKNIKVGQKATLTFDALPDLTMTGTVAEVDALGTVSQGVVTYSVKIAFDTSEDQVKSGMTVSAAIITDSKTDTLIVPVSAVKTRNNQSYVQILPASVGVSASSTMVTTNTTPVSVNVETGLSNDSEIEIVSGLNEGDMVITKTTTATTASASTARSATSLLGGGNARSIAR